MRRNLKLPPPASSDAELDEPLVILKPVLRPAIPGDRFGFQTRAALPPSYVGAQTVAEYTAEQASPRLVSGHAQSSHQCLQQHQFMPQAALMLINDLMPLHWMRYPLEGPVLHGLLQASVLMT
ncbi:hypothetical protein JVT61DRAFT_14217 [Boletus reticuloceps]|uniref:Uncharacterized protein n=1 Tax=Boletus reticuloceps TaxID=495285 RepID=A0A8I2YCZ6_9AGAM|nr:hypothetical protein JVT61DRAFT_14217 [Boletus reticuloceps]